MLPAGVRGAAGPPLLTRPPQKEQNPKMLGFDRGAPSGEWRLLGLGDGERMLAFDIETTGLDPGACEVTCACAYDGRGTERAFVFEPGGPRRSDHPRDYGFEGGWGDPEEFMGLLDAAPRLCAFNGVRFDLPFLARRWGVPDARVGAWVRKLFDPFEACRLGLGRTFSLERLLAANGLRGKTGSGLEAIAMAREGRWAELAEYCMHDTRMTHAAAAMGALALPPPAQRRR